MSTTPDLRSGVFFLPPGAAAARPRRSEDVAGVLARRLARGSGRGRRRRVLEQAHLVQEVAQRAADAHGIEAEQAADQATGIDDETVVGARIAEETVPAGRA